MKAHYFRKYQWRLRLFKENKPTISYRYDVKKWLKLFIYLNDVNDENGAHCFIKTDHEKEKFNLLNYFPDKEIMSYYNENEIFRVNGKNTCFLKTLLVFIKKYVKGN